MCILTAGFLSHPSQLRKVWQQMVATVVSLDCFRSAVPWQECFWGAVDIAGGIASSPLIYWTKDLKLCRRHSEIQSSRYVGALPSRAIDNIVSSVIPAFCTGRSKSTTHELRQLATGKGSACEEVPMRYGDPGKVILKS